MRPKQQQQILHRLPLSLLPQSQPGEEDAEGGEIDVRIPTGTHTWIQNVMRIGGQGQIKHLGEGRQGGGVLPWETGQRQGQSGNVRGKFRQEEIINVEGGEHFEQLQGHILDGGIHKTRLNRLYQGLQFIDVDGDCTVVSMNRCVH